MLFLVSGIGSVGARADLNEREHMARSLRDVAPNRSRCQLAELGIIGKWLARQMRRIKTIRHALGRSLQRRACAVDGITSPSAKVVADPSDAREVRDDDNKNGQKGHEQEQDSRAKQADKQAEQVWTALGLQQYHGLRIGPRCYLLVSTRRVFDAIRHDLHHRKTPRVTARRGIVMGPSEEVRLTPVFRDTGRFGEGEADLDLE